MSKPINITVEQLVALAVKRSQIIHADPEALLCEVIADLYGDVDPNIVINKSYVNSIKAQLPLEVTTSDYVRDGAERLAGEAFDAELLRRFHQDVNFRS